MTYLEDPAAATPVEKCLSCKEGYYWGVPVTTPATTTYSCVPANPEKPTEPKGPFKGCLSSSDKEGKKCDMCNPYFEYVMYMPGMCEKKSMITEEFLMKAKMMAALSTGLVVSLAGLLVFFGLQL